MFIHFQFYVIFNNAIDFKIFINFDIFIFLEKISINYL